ncbi:MAG TPA: thiamine pyrophosphate-dependent enzyme [Bacteroidales bacterium]|jgi:indolepyruvate ferredoxin oxidoreductase alpha subunit|nr:indolepyruvate ferredoxin oxidoreductase [Bacteroidales bacterium]HOF45683.1 thiamine pyrophosphate-dependent enzyme [Bacteroidales bacterium]HOS57878.1 thiamine pyrophosphate-dependent enzyme [Bacteroidales bacterium]HRR04974.1 thiamine pyrophosphate-dependent enzyme [Bacteroidales bacterium]HRT12985.1 thiamine pyrophosphate-dependent enzyme [Bacteroidales bacterium]
MSKLLLLGDEAIAQAALDAGLSGIYAYPGTPSTEIMEYIQRSKQAAEGNVHRIWSTNEKTALETAIGMSYAGKRSIVCMKHVGLNVAADPFMNLSITGTNGGLVILIADDPSMHSSQNEQDSRFFAKFAMIPCFEPSNQQEAYDMTYKAFDFSEKHRVPVMLRVTTRLAHSRAGVTRKEVRSQNEISLHPNPKQFILLPGNARVFYKEALAKQPKLNEESENSSFNQYFDGKDKSLGIIASGIALNYVKENFVNKEIPYPILKITQYPLPVKKIEKLFNDCEKILVVEEGYPIIEEQLKGLLDKSGKIKGRLDGTLPRDGELNPNIVAKALDMPIKEGPAVPSLVVPRPPALCKGCPHIDSYLALNEVMESYGKGRVFSDIGCYTLGALPPYHAIYSTVDMGASITMAKGAAIAGLVPAVAVIGDSTFTHSGMTSLLDAVYSKTPITVLILDNDTTGMTGGQDSHAFGRLASICKGLGVEEEHIRQLKPLRNFHEENVKVIREEVEYQGVSVIILERECIQTLSRRMRKLKTKTK